MAALFQGIKAWLRGSTTLLALAALIGLAPLSASADCKLKALQLPVKMVGSRPIATIGINGTQVPLLVDTGAFYSMLTEAAASQLHLRTRALPDGFRITGFTGSIQARLTKVEKVQLANGTIPDVEFITGLNEVGGGAMGVLGRNFLSVTDSEFDLAHGMIRLVLPTGDCDDTNMAYWADDASTNVVPIASLRDRSNAFLVNVSVNGDKVKALLDTGAPESTLMLSTARSAGIKESEMTPSYVVGGGGSGHAKSWFANVETIDVGGERIRHNKLEVVDTDWVEQGVILGVDYFLSHRIFVAKSQNRLYATWNGGAIFGRNAAAPADDVAKAADADASTQDADALLRSGMASAARKDFVHALADIDRACALAPADASCPAARARVHFEMKNPLAAGKDLDAALRIDPALSQARIDRAGLRMVNLDRDGALEDLRALDAALPMQSNLRAAMASVYAELDLPDEALHQWDVWLAKHGKDGGRDHVLNGRCWLRVKLNLNLDLALEDCREAVDESPDQSAYHDSLGWVYVRRGNLAQAIKEFDKAISLDAKSSWSYYGRGLARMRQSAQAPAQADLAKARALLADIDVQARKHGMSVE